MSSPALKGGGGKSSARIKAGPAKTGARIKASPVKSAPIRSRGRPGQLPATGGTNVGPPPELKTDFGQVVPPMRKVSGRRRRNG